MTTPLLRSLVCASLLLSFIARAEDAPTVTPAPAISSEPRHVILIIGDGMDDQQITIARNYLVGAQGRLLLDQMPVRGVAQVLTVKDQVDSAPVYVADSANTATSMATGAVTSRGRISTTAGTDKDIPTIIELAEAAGYRTGLVSTASVTDATPAAFIAHTNYRMCENPDLIKDVTISGIHIGDCKQDLKANGGKGSISEQLADSGVDVILGGGRKHFAPKAEDSDMSVLENAQAAGFHTVQTSDELAASPGDKRLLGLFSKGTMPVRLRGQDDRAAEASEHSLLNHVHEYLGEITPPAPMVCEPNPKFASVPSLQQMTQSALDHLSHNNDRGFFLMVESASIDKQSHERKPCGSIGELAQLNEALASALDFAATHPNTLVIVTADHAQAAQLIPFESLYGSFPIPVGSPGLIARIITPEGSHMTVNYATSTFMMEEHTGANVPVFANEEGRGRVATYITQPEIFDISREYLGL